MCKAVIEEYGGRYRETILFTILAYIWLLFPFFALLQALGVVAFGPPEHHQSPFENWVAVIVGLSLAVPSFHFFRRMGRRTGALLQVYEDSVVYSEWRAKSRTLPITRRTHVEGDELVFLSEDGSSCESIGLGMLQCKTETEELTALIERIASML